MSTTIKNLGFKPPKELGRKICDGCKEEVTEYEGYYIGGEHKGKPFNYIAGCKCEEIKLAAAAQATHERMMKKKIINIFKMYSLINDKLKHCSFSSYEPKTDEQKEALLMAQNFVKDIKNGEKYNILLTGSYGVGKSHLAVATVKELMSDGISCVFCTVPMLLRKIRASYKEDKKGASEDEILSGLEFIDVLVLDDIGAEKETDWTLEKLFEIIDARSGKPTFYTTNLNSKQLNEHVGSRNFSRLMQDTKPLKIIGSDYRLKEF